MENLGTRDLPYKIGVHNQMHRRASYFLIELNIPPGKIDDLMEEATRDVDIVRRRLYKAEKPLEEPCTLEDEMQPPPYRKNVQELIEQARSLDKPKYEYNTGLDYYPFQK